MLSYFYKRFNILKESALFETKVRIEFSKGPSELSAFVTTLLNTVRLQTTAMVRVRVRVYVCIHEMVLRVVPCCSCRPCIVVN